MVNTGCILFKELKHEAARQKFNDAVQVRARGRAVLESRSLCCSLNVPPERNRQASVPGMPADRHRSTLDRPLVHSVPSCTQLSFVYQSIQGVSPLVGTLLDSLPRPLLLPLSRHAPTFPYTCALSLALPSPLCGLLSGDGACPFLPSPAQALGYQPELLYNIALCYYKTKQFGPALKHLAEIIEKAVREHPELSVGRWGRGRGRGATPGTVARS